MKCIHQCISNLQSPPQHQILIEFQTKARLLLPISSQQYSGCRRIPDAKTCLPISSKTTGRDSRFIINIDWSCLLARASSSLKKKRVEVLEKMMGYNCFHIYPNYFIQLSINPCLPLPPPLASRPFPSKKFSSESETKILREYNTGVLHFSFLWNKINTHPLKKEDFTVESNVSRQYSLGTPCQLCKQVPAQ